LTAGARAPRPDDFAEAAGFAAVPPGVTSSIACPLDPRD
jgi:hypothetical protein